MSVRFLDRDRTVVALRDLAARIGAARPEVREIRLFGSLARDERNPYADADLLVVLDGCDVPFRDRAPLYKPLDTPVPTDLLVCTTSELEREVGAANPFVQQILGESLALYARSDPPAAS